MLEEENQDIGGLSGGLGVLGAIGLIFTSIYLCYRIYFDSYFDSSSSLTDFIDDIRVCAIVFYISLILFAYGIVAHVYFLQNAVGDLRRTIKKQSREQTTELENGEELQRELTESDESAP